VSVTEIEAGLWGYNSVLGAVAIGGLFYTLNFTTAVLAVLCASLCAILTGTFQSMFAHWGIPVLTFPFCIGAMIFVFIQGIFTHNFIQQRLQEAHHCQFQ
jgi:urea transporter